MTRRVLLGTGAAVVVSAGALTAAGLTHRLDDVAEAVGIEPTPLPDPVDDKLLRAAALDMAAVTALSDATASRHPALDLGTLAAIVRTQLDAVGGSTAATDLAAPSADPATALTALVDAYRTASKARAAQALRAVSPELVLVLASMSAGLSQCARAAEQRR
ncbi:MAG: hypothetical protein ABWX74_14165 [Aeromicrobium sp.]